MIEATIACPKCKSSELLPPDAEGDSQPFRCSHCRTEFPVWDGVPIFFANPEAFRLQWAARLAFRRAEIARQKTQTLHSPQFASLPPSTQKRLTQVCEAQDANLRSIQGWLSETLEGASPAQIPAAAVAAERIAPTQHFESYIETVFRDWCWGENEVRSATQILLPAIQQALPDGPAQVAAFGSGAGRVVCELAASLPSTHWTAVDINPLLLQIHRRMLKGESLRLNEIPTNAASLQDVAIQQRLSSTLPRDLIERIKIIASDALNPCFKSRSLDAVLTSWWIDIVPDDLADLSRRINRTLKKDGVWIIHGPLGFSNPGLPRAYTEQELLELLPGCGFEVTHHEQLEQPYLHSPHGRQKRFEKIMIMVCKKKQDTQEPRAYQTSPEYLTNPNHAIGPALSFREAAEDAHVRALVLAAIDGKRTFNEISKMIAGHFKIADADARTILEQILITTPV